MSLNDIMIKFIHKMDRHLRKITYTIHHACIKMHAFITFLYFDIVIIWRGNTLLIVYN